jgi:hypothetical protein
MLSTLFGKRERKIEADNQPWDELSVGSVRLAIWRSDPKDGVRRYVFGLSRAWERNGKRSYAKTIGVEHFWDLLTGLEELALKLSARPDVSRQDREVLIGVQKGLERVLATRPGATADTSNGRDEPTR